MLLVEIDQNRFRNRGDIVLAVAQRRQHDLEHIQPVVQIFAQKFVLNSVFRNLVGGRNDANLYRQIDLSAQPADLAFFENAQQFGLRADRHVADLIQKHRSVVSLLEAADVTFERSREGALLVPEQLAFNQRFGQRGAVDGNKRPSRPRSSNDGARAPPVLFPFRFRL